MSFSQRRLRRFTLATLVLGGLLAGPAHAAQDAYFSDFGEGSIAAAFDVAPGGALSKITGSPFGPAGEEPEGLVVSPDARFVYAVADDEVHGFSRSASGALVPTPQSP